MAHAPTRIANRPVWVDLASQDATGSRRFYEQLFGWNVEVNPDPQYGGYGRAKVGGKDAAGISPAQSPDQPSMWSFYIGTEDADMCGQRVQEAGGKVVVPAMDVGDQGRFATFQDPSGAFISVWQPTGMGGFEAQGPNAFGWAELNARGVEKALTFYRDVFGWSLKRTPIPNSSDYIEFQLNGDSIAGATELNPMAPPEMPSHWLVYFSVDDVSSTFQKAISLGAREMTPPQEYQGGEFAILTDPQGATFGLFKSSRR